MPGLMVLRKDSLMADDMEEFITDAIIIAKVKLEEEPLHMEKMADAINKKLNEHFGGSRIVLIKVSKCQCSSASSGIPLWNGTYIEVEHGHYNFVVFRK